MYIYTYLYTQLYNNIHIYIVVLVHRIYTFQHAIDSSPPYPALIQCGFHSPSQGLLLHGLLVVHKLWAMRQPFFALL